MRGARCCVGLNIATRVLRKHNLENPTDFGWKHTLEPVTYASFSAIFGTQAVVQAKCLALLLKLGAEAFKHYLIYLTLVGWLCFVGVWLTRMNDALGKCKRGHASEASAKKSCWRQRRANNRRGRQPPTRAQTTDASANNDRRERQQ